MKELIELVLKADETTRKRLVKALPIRAQQLLKAKPNATFEELMDACADGRKSRSERGNYVLPGITASEWLEANYPRLVEDIRSLDRPSFLLSYLARKVD